MQQPLAKKPHEGTSFPGSTSPASPFDRRSNPVSGYPGASSLTGQLTLVNLSPDQIVENAHRYLKKLTGSDALLSRTAAHVTVILLALLAIGLSNVQWSWGAIKAIRPANQPVAVAPATTPVPEPALPFKLPATLRQAPDIFGQAAVPHTIIPERSREEISTYLVQSGDTVFGIATKFGLNPETIQWSNSSLEKYPDLLRVGQELTILPVDGVYHQVGSGDTIESIAGTFKADPAAIINFPLNGVDPENPVIQVGQWLVVPGGVKPFVPRTVTAYTGPLPDDATAGTGSFAWPASGTIYQGYFDWHPAIDIAGYRGEPVVAADSGYVVMAGWDNTGYGNHVVIDHGNGYQTLYAHLDTYFVEAGENVAQGQEIGEMGDTGNATGPHLHFEVRQGTIQRNPSGFLP